MKGGQSKSPGKARLSKVIAENKSTIRPFLTILSESDRERVFFAAQEVLDTTGVRIHDKWTLDLLGEAGARIDGNVAYIPPRLVNDALEAAPKEIQIYTRDGQPCMLLSGWNCYFGNGTDCPYVLDPFSGERRQFLESDVETASILCDALTNLDFVMPTGIVSDRPSLIADMYQFKAMMMNTRKPIIFTSYTPENHRDIVRMAAIAAGGEEELRERPFIISYVQPISPLTYPVEVCEKLRFCAENRVPVICTPAPMSGGTAPVTIAGTVVLCLAESLSALVIGQLINRGTPMITVGIPTVLNMRTGAISFDAPELQIMSTALFDMRKFIKVPMWSMAAASDSKTFDEQAVINATMSCTFQALGGANLIHGIGCLDSGLATSLELIVLTDEIIGMLRRILSGMNTTPDHLALEVINEVGHGGEYLTHGHTLDHFRELWDSKLIDRSGYETWLSSGGRTMGQRIRDKIRDILKNHMPDPISDDRRSAILEVLRVREEGL